MINAAFPRDASNKRCPSLTSLLFVVCWALLCMRAVAGVTALDCDVAAKKVVVTGSMPAAEVTEKLSKWATAANKEVRFVQQLS